MVGYGLYVGLNNGFQFKNVQTETPDWLKQEMRTENGIPQVTPPQVTPPQVNQPQVTPPQIMQPSNPAQTGPTNGVAKNNTATAPVTVPAITAPPTESTTFPPVAVPQARYANEPNGKATAIAQNQTTSAGPQAIAVLPSGATQPAGPVAETGPGSTAQTAPTTRRPATALPADVNITSTDDAPDLSRPVAVDAAVTSVENKFNLSQDLAFTTAIKSAKIQLQQGQLATALLTLSIWYEDPRLNASQQDELTQLLDRVAGSVIYSRKHLIEPAYTVKQGETLEKIAQAHRVPVGLLVKINGIQNPQNLTTGQQLKVVRGPFNATVNGEKSELTLWLGGRYAGRFQLVMGPEFQSIVGPFVVHQKTRAHPEHGNRPWIRLSPGYEISENLQPSNPQIGFAGMHQPEAVSQGSVPGQIGVSVEDADDLYDILSQGSKVTIQR